MNGDEWFDDRDLARVLRILGITGLIFGVAIVAVAVAIAVSQ